MLHISKWKYAFVILVSVLGVLYAAPNMASPATRARLAATLPGWMPSKTVSLGLDLQGGSHLLMEVDTALVVKERLEAMLDAARTELRKQDIGYVDLTAGRDGISFKVRGIGEKRDAVYKILREIEPEANIDINGETGLAALSLSESALRELNTQVVNQSIEIIRRRVDETGTKEPVIQRQGEKRIVVQLPGIDDPERVKALIGKTAKMAFHLVDMEAAVAGSVSPGSKRLPLRENRTESVVIKKRVMISGDMLTDSQPTFEQGAPVVSFRFNAIGAKRFCDVTRDNVGKPFAIVLDDEVISAPVIRDAICGGGGIISGRFTVKEAHDLSLLLRAGALPAPLNVVEERSVGPTLGSDSIASGKIAGAIGLLMVMVFMAVTYGLFGWFANLALILNIVFIFALLSLMQATLTLPGIAGIILTIGMAVDANVLIFERIREELKNGRTVIAAVDSGYKMALGTIVDSNLTTLIVALILFSFGSGPVKGFAVAMTVGIVTSLFSAIMVTRLMVVAWLRQKRPQTLAI